MKHLDLINSQAQKFLKEIRPKKKTKKAKKND